MKDDPCFACALPDCDDMDERCAVRQLKRTYDNKCRRGERDQVTEAELDANSRIYDSWLVERMAQAAEGVRPLNKPNSPWRPGEARP